MCAKRFCSALRLLATALVIGALDCPVRGSSLAWDHDATLSYDTSTASESPQWNGGALLALERQLTASPVIRSFDRQGVHLASVTLSIPESTAIFVHGYSKGPDGTIAMCGTAFDREGESQGS